MLDIITVTHSDATASILSVVSKFPENLIKELCLRVRVFSLNFENNYSYLNFVLATLGVKFELIKGFTFASEAKAYLIESAQNEIIYIDSKAYLSTISLRNKAKHSFSKILTKQLVFDEYITETYLHKNLYCAHFLKNSFTKAFLTEMRKMKKYEDAAIIKFLEFQNGKIPIENQNEILILYKNYKPFDNDLINKEYDEYKLFQMMKTFQ